MEQAHREGGVVVRIESRPWESQRHEGASARLRVRFLIEMANRGVDAHKRSCSCDSLFLKNTYLCTEMVVARWSGGLGRCVSSLRQGKEN